MNYFCFCQICIAYIYVHCGERRTLFEITKAPLTLFIITSKKAEVFKFENALIKVENRFIWNFESCYFWQQFLSNRSWLLLLFWIYFMKVRPPHNYQCVLIANAEDGLSLIFVLQNIMAAMGLDGPSLPFDFKIPF